MTTCYVIADSFGQFGPTGLAYVASTRLGWTPTLDAQGGTGFASGTEGATWYADRTAAALAASPDVIVILGAMNDRTKATAMISAQAAVVFAALSTVPVYVLVLAGSGGTPSGNAAAMADTVAAIQAAATGTTAIVIDGTSWITGSGTEAAPAGDGNGDVYVQSDGIHPNAAGHSYLGTRLAFAISPPATGLVF